MGQFLQRKGITRFELELSALEKLAFYSHLQRAFPSISMVWEEYQLNLYLQNGFTQDLEGEITPSKVRLYKTKRTHIQDSIYHWEDGRLMELNGERFAESSYEYRLIQALGEWFTHTLSQLAEHQLSYDYLTEHHFKERNQATIQDVVSLQQKISLLAQDIERKYHTPTRLHVVDFFSHTYWYSGICAELVLQGDKPLILQFDIRNGQVRVQGEEDVLIYHEKLLQVVKLLMKERAYGQVSSRLLEMAYNKNRKG